MFKTYPANFCHTPYGHQGIECVWPGYLQVLAVLGVTHKVRFRQVLYTSYTQHATSSFHIFLKGFLKLSQKLNALLKKKLHYYSLLKSIINLRSFFLVARQSYYFTMKIKFLIFSQMFSWNAQNLRCSLKKNNSLLFSAIGHLQLKQFLFKFLNYLLAKT